MSIILSILILLAGWIVLIPVLFIGVLMAGYGLDYAYQMKAPKKVIYFYWIIVITSIAAVFIGYPLWVF